MNLPKNSEVFLFCDQVIRCYLMAFENIFVVQKYKKLSIEMKYVFDKLLCIPTIY